MAAKHTFDLELNLYQFEINRRQDGFCDPQ